MGEQITNSQSRRRCHCYGPVRAPASWCLGARHQPGSGATSSGGAEWPGSRVSALVPACASRLAGRPLARSRAQPRPSTAVGSEAGGMQPPGPPPAYAPANGDFTFVSSADAEGESPAEGRGQGWLSGDSAPVPAGPSPEAADDSGGCGARAPPLGHPL